jgi:4-hydroxybenzoate polyprenyltransferase
MALHALGGAKGPGAAFAGACTALLILFYDRFHKGFAWSPVVMGLCRAGLYALSALAFKDELEPGVTLAALLLLAYVVGLTHVARFETSSAIHRMWPALFVFGPILSGAFKARLLSPGELFVLVPLLLFAVGFVAHAIWLLRRGGPARIRSAVGRLIAGIALLDALSLTVHGAPRLAGVSLVLFGATLLFQRRIRGT